MTDIEVIAPDDKKSARRTSDSYVVAWEKRTALVKNGLAEERAACDSKTIKLRALRLAKEEADREAASMKILTLAASQKSAKRAAR